MKSSNNLFHVDSLYIEDKDNKIIIVFKHSRETVRNSLKSFIATPKSFLFLHGYFVGKNIFTTLQFARFSIKFTINDSRWFVERQKNFVIFVASF